MPLIEVSDADLAVLARIHERQETQDIPHPDFEGATEGLPSLRELTASLDLSLSGDGFHMLSELSIPLFPRREKKSEEHPSSSMTPWVTAILIVMVLIGIVSYESSTLPETTHSASPHVSVKTFVPIVQRSDYSVVSGPTITENYIEHKLCSYNQNLCGTGQALYDDGVRYNIDPAFALAFFWHESNFGTQGMAAPDKSLGNLRCIYNELDCNGGYAQFATWQDGYTAWFALLAGPLYVGDGRTTPEGIIPRYAPNSDNNDEAAYIASVEASVAAYRIEGGR